MHNNSDCVAICFALDKPDSFKEAVSKWRIEINNLGPLNVATILVGLKKDLRDNMEEKGAPNDKFVSSKEGSEASEKYKFLSYVECSAKLFENCDDVFHEAIRAASLVEKIKITDKNVSKESCCDIF